MKNGTGPNYNHTFYDIIHKLSPARNSEKMIQVSAIIILSQRSPHVKSGQKQLEIDTGLSYNHTFRVFFIMPGVVVARQKNGAALSYNQRL